MVLRSKTPEYRAWINMRSRCYNRNIREFAWYGARGIEVCERWRKSFDAFLADVGPRPSGDHSLDRIDSDGHYQPGNVRWATWNAQMNNRRNNVWIEALGKRLTVGQWSRELGITAYAVRRRFLR